MKIGFGEFWQAVKDICFPPVCLACHVGLGPVRHDVHLCRPCEAKVKLLDEPLCYRCGKPFVYSAGGNHLCGSCLSHTWHFTCARAVVQYRSPITEAIHLFKYAGHTAALPLFAGLKKKLTHLNKLMEPDLILPVPLHRDRLRQRGFNQAQVLAGIFFPDQKEKIDIASLKRHRPTTPQTGLSGVARRKNIKGAFRVAGKKVEGKKVLLVDDVFTTGTTVNECAYMLCRAGAMEIQVLTLAKVVL